MKTIGYTKQPEADYQGRAVWSPTSEYKDMLLGDSLFIPCETADECVAILAKRLGVESYPVVTRHQTSYGLTMIEQEYGNKVLVRTVPYLQMTSKLNFPQLVEAVEKFGRVESYSVMVQVIRTHPSYNASNLVITKDKVVVSDPDRAKARRVLKAQEPVRKAKREALKAAKEAKEEKEREEQRHVNSLWDGLDDLMWKACKDLHHRLPKLIRESGYVLGISIVTNSPNGMAYDDFAKFFAFVRYFHKTGCKRLRVDPVTTVLSKKAFRYYRKHRKSLFSAHRRVDLKDPDDMWARVREGLDREASRSLDGR